MSMFTPMHLSTSTIIIKVAIPDRAIVTTHPKTCTPNKYPLDVIPSFS